MERLRKAVIVVAVAVGVALVAVYEDGPAEKAGERVDRALDQDRAFATGPVEAAGRAVDKPVDGARR
jgi:hypothetical protein